MPRESEANRVAGRLVVLEGPDGVGKSTIASLLSERLQKLGFLCETMSFPGKEPGSLGHVVYEIHHNPAAFKIQRMAAGSLQLLHVAAHIDAIESRIRPAIQRSSIVILDRFWWSTWVYGLVDGVSESLLRAAVDTERLAWGDLRPTITVLLERQQATGEGIDSVKWETLKTEYKRLATREAERCDVRTVINDGALSATVELIASLLLERLQIRVMDSVPALESPNGSDAGQLELQSGDLQHSLSFAVADEKKQTFKVGMHCENTMSEIMLPARSTPVFNTYWQFAAERQAIFFRKLRDQGPPWTEDEILETYKFTNAYRASDRVSQYLIRKVIYEGNQSPKEVFFRILLFKLFNRISTWERLQKKLGEITYRSYSFSKYENVLRTALNSGERIYSAAYIMPSAKSAFGHSQKHRNHLRLLESLMDDDVPHQVDRASSMREVFSILSCYPSLGDFLAYQLSIDINYSDLTHFSEMDFVVPGPGARSGLRKCFSDFGGLNEVEIITRVANIQQKEFARLGIEFESLWGRPLQLVDCQNLFCEVDKYARIAHPEVVGLGDRTRIKQKYVASSDRLVPWYPPKWGLNERIRKEFAEL